MEAVNGAGRWMAAAAAILLLGVLTAHLFAKPHLTDADVESISRSCNSDVIRPLLEDLQQRVSGLETEVRNLRRSLEKR